MANDGLSEFISKARESKSSDEQIRNLLIQHGWETAVVDSALKPVGNSSISVPPPPAQHFGMWIAFLYIILFISLYVFAVAFAGIAHYAVDEHIKDDLDTLNYAYYAGQYLMQTYLSCLIVGFPVFGFLFIFLKLQVQKNPAIKGLRVRKILIYMTLVGTFLLLMGHIIGTVYNLLGGSVTLRAVAHLGVTFFVAGSIFVYFLLDVWGDRKQS